MNTIERRWLPAVGGAVLLYCLWAGLLIAQRPGLQYDEALLVLGSVHMRHSSQELALPHDPDTWICRFGRCLPLMTVRYVGALKEYMCLPLFALFGPSAEVLRCVNMLLGAFCIWGIGTLIARQVNGAAGAASSFGLAMHPAFVDLTIFDNGAIAAWMGVIGLLCLALNRYLLGPGPAAAFAVGLALGLGIWARANFLWLAAAIVVAALLNLRKRVLTVRSHWAALAAGGVLGGFPFLVYQIVSRGGTWQALDMVASQSTLQERLLTRLVMLSETLLSDREHRAIWGGPELPEWQRWLFLAVVAGACLVCFAVASRRDPHRTLWARAVAMVLLFLAGPLLLARLQVAEHHLVVLVPLAVVTTVLAGLLLRECFRWGSAATTAVALLYGGSAAYWQVAAIRGLQTSGGVGQWSDAVVTLAEHLETKYAGRQIKILDWGLQNNLYLLSDGRIRSVELHYGASDAERQIWLEEIRNGGIFLLNAPENRHFPAIAGGFLSALAMARPVARRFAVFQRDGRPYAEIIEVEPDSGRFSAPQNANQPPAATITTADPAVAGQLEGFHQIEQARWRWTKRQFSITLGASEAASGARLVVRLFVPDTIIRQLGPATLSARFGGHSLGREVYREPGEHTFTREIAAGWLKRGANRFEFELGKALAPNPSDGRELGVIVVAAALEPPGQATAAPRD
jgi:hypothetical protein